MEKVKLVAISQPQIYLGEEGESRLLTPSEFLAYVARVSNPSNQLNVVTADKLMKYLVQHQHWSPFEMISLTLEIKTTRDIGRQILRHRSFSFQEFSQRYQKVDPTSFVTDREARLQDTKNRQNSIETDDNDLKEEWQAMQTSIMYDALFAYDWALENGIAKEVARAVLPEGLTPTHIYMAGTLRSWIHYCSLRMSHGTQKEHQEIAKECWKIITREIPSLINILD